MNQCVHNVRPKFWFRAFIFCCLHVHIWYEIRGCYWSVSLNLDRLQLAVRCIKVQLSGHCAGFDSANCRREFLCALALWRHGIPVLLAPYEGNSTVNSASPSQRADNAQLWLNKPLNKQPTCRTFETPWHPQDWRHFDGNLDFAYLLGTR